MDFPLAPGGLDPAASPMIEAEVLHVIVGHGLPVMFHNAISSFRSVLPEAKLLVIDNASPQLELREALHRRAETDPHMELILRQTNEMVDTKVGGLYQAYQVAFDVAHSEGFKYVHLMQADMQLLWWDQDALRKASEIYQRHPQCVNIHTHTLSKDYTLCGLVVVESNSGDAVLPEYGMTDTGLFHLPRWDASGMQFEDSEEAIAAKGLERGLKVVVSPWPTEVQVPWPAVTRQGRQRGREVRTAKPFLCRPLDVNAVAAVKASSYPLYTEDLCVPWGWSCLSPMSETDLSKWYYLNDRRIDLRQNGWKRGSPRWIITGLDRRLDIFITPHRPSLVALFLRPLPSLARELAQRHIFERRTRKAASLDARHNDLS
jgi:hypothetical protein